MAVGNIRASTHRADLEAEYTQARYQLTRLAKEGGELGPGAEELIIKLDKSYALLLNRLDNSVAFEFSPTAPLPPPVDRFRLRGILAYRAWQMEVRGVLSPAIMWQGSDAWAHEVAFAHKIPDRYNRLGLHATRIEMWQKNSYSDYVSGLVDLYGRVVEHEDGVMRAECARIITLFLHITDNNQVQSLVTGAYELLRNTYPNVPIYPVTTFQKELYLWREVLLNYKAVRTD